MSCQASLPGLPFLSYNSLGHSHSLISSHCSVYFSSNFASIFPSLVLIFFIYAEPPSLSPFFPLDPNLLFLLFFLLSGLPCLPRVPPFVFNFSLYPHPLRPSFISPLIVSFYLSLMARSPPSILSAYFFACLLSFFSSFRVLFLLVPHPLCIKTLDQYIAIISLKGPSALGGNTGSMIPPNSSTKQIPCLSN